MEEGRGDSSGAVVVLLVEDNLGDARLVKEALAGLQPIDPVGPRLELVVADRLEAGLGRLAAGGIDAVLLDLSLPDSHGFETFARMHARAPGIPIILLSGLDDEALAARAVREGAQDYLAKGRLDGDLLVRAIRYAIERKRAELERDRLARERFARVEAEWERDRLQQVLEALPEGIAIADRRGRVVMTNGAARAVWGWSSDGDRRAEDGRIDVSGVEISRLDGTPWPAEETPLLRSVRAGEVVQGEQMLIRNLATGRQVPVLINSAPLTEPGGAVAGAVAVFQDISTLKDLERQKEEFLAAASHDLMTPVSTIKGLAQLLRRRIARTDHPINDRLDEGLGRIDQGATRLAAMVADMLDVARVQMGRPLDLDRGPTDLVALARQVAAAARATTGRHRIVVDGPESLVGVWDRVRLGRVLENLVGNAIKYSPRGGDVVVQVGCDGDGSHGSAVLSVRDRGVGIPAAEQPRVFERFYRGSNVQGRTAGTGIGLTGVRQIVEQHGGTISVESTEGAGTTFTVRLPLTSQEME